MSVLTVDNITVGYGKRLILENQSIVFDKPEIISIFVILKTSYLTAFFYLISFLSSLSIQIHSLRTVTVFISDPARSDNDLIPLLLSESLHLPICPSGILTRRNSQSASLHSSLLH